MVRKGWNINVDLYWCMDINAPVLDFPPPEYSCKKLHLPPPGDARLMLPDEMNRLNEAVKESFNDVDSKYILQNQKVVLLAKEPYIDERRRIILGGENIGSIYYNPYNGKYLFRPSELTAYILIHNQIIDPINLKYVKNGDLLRINKNTHIVIAKIEERQGAILEKVKDNLYRVRRVFELEKNEKRYEIFADTIKKQTDINDLIKYNDYALYYYTSRSKKFLHIMASKINKDIIVSYSGGKDSLVTLHLTMETGIEPVLMFNNTGIELPETIEAVKKAIDEYQLRHEVADAGDSFWRAVTSFGPPARNYRWCCKVVKLVPFARLTRRIWPNGALNILGQRAYESYDRARSPKVWRNQWAPHVLSIAPIHEWPQFILWLYIYKHKLTPLLNPLYYKGFERIGCYLCPASTLAEFHIVSTIHPELWNKWTNMLRKFGCNNLCIKLGLWRWLGPSSIKKQLIQKKQVKYNWKIEYLSHLPNKPLKARISENGAQIEFENPLTKGLHYQVAILQGIRKDEKTIETPVAIVEQFDKHVNIIFKKKIPKDKRIEYILDVLKIVYRGEYCAQCRSCELWCPTNAIKVDETPKVNPEKCIGCLVCVKECPLAELTVDKVISSIILERPDGWRRPGKIKRKETINIIKNLTLKKLGAHTVENTHRSDYTTNIINDFDKY